MTTRLQILCALLLWLLLVVPAAHCTEPVVRQPLPAVPLGDITLADGRTLYDARLLGATAGGLSLGHRGGILQVPRAQIPAEILAPHAEHIAARQAEYEAERNVVRHAAAGRERLRAANLITARHENERAGVRKIIENEAAKVVYEAELATAQAKVDREAAQHAEALATLLARSHHGLFIQSVRRHQRGLIITVTNLDAHTQPFDWRALRFRTAAREYAPAGCRPRDSDTFLDLRTRQSRSFLITFIGGPKPITAYRWPGGEWRVFK